MSKVLKGVSFESTGDYAVCHIELLSDEVQELIRKNLSSICHGSRATSTRPSVIYGYKATLNSFLERCATKTPETQIGMIGEFLSHVLLPYYFDDFRVVSPFFNMEEKSIKKGFDLLLFRLKDSTIWITEVKSGNVHKNKNYDQTTTDLLRLARDDLKKRLGSEETMYWYNALNTVYASVSDKDDYKDSLQEILMTYGDEAASNTPDCSGKNVVLVSSLFQALDSKISIETVKNFHEKLSHEKTFSSVIALCFQKATYIRVVQFLKEEAEKDKA